MGVVAASGLKQLSRDETYSDGISHTYSCENVDSGEMVSETIWLLCPPFRRDTVQLMHDAFEMTSLDITSKRLLPFVLFGAFLLTGLIDNTLTKMGFETLANGIWILGYGHIIVIIWYVWIRPLDLSGPTGTTEVADQEDPK